MKTVEVDDKTNLSNLHYTRRKFLQGVAGLVLTRLANQGLDRPSSQSGLQSTNPLDQEFVQTVSGEELVELIRMFYQDLAEKNSQAHKDQHHPNLTTEILVLIAAILVLRGVLQLSREFPDDQKTDESNNTDSNLSADLDVEQELNNEGDFDDVNAVTDCELESEEQVDEELAEV